MKLETLTDTIGLGDLICDDCGRANNPIVTVIGLGFSGRLYFCDGCLEKLRNVIRRTRARRPLSPRSRLALTALQDCATGRLTHKELTAAIGKYGTNVVAILLERGLLERDGEHVKSSSYSLTPKGRNALDILELSLAK